MQPADVLTDMVAEPYPLTCLNDFVDNLNFHSESDSSDNGESERFYVHEGMLKSARNLASQLSALVLTQAVLYPSYAVVVTGHSLGGGTAALLYLIWRNSERFRGVKLVGHAHACPSVASPNLDFGPNVISNSTEPKSPPSESRPSCSSNHCHSGLNDQVSLKFAATCLGRDVVPRLSLRSIEFYRAQLDYLVSVEQALQDVIEKQGDDSGQILQAVWSSLLARKKAQLEFQMDPKMVLLPPGRKSLFIPDSRLTVNRSAENQNQLPNVPTNSSSAAALDAFWTTSTSSSSDILNVESHDSTEANYFWMPSGWFDEIVLSTSMLNIHMPQQYEDALKRLQGIQSNRDLR